MSCTTCKAPPAELIRNAQDLRFPDPVGCMGRGREAPCCRPYAKRSESSLTALFVQSQDKAATICNGAGEKREKSFSNYNHITDRRMGRAGCSTTDIS
ncbi:hypothetical protein EYF80_017041 [Liparis tanakae]|uniref:Uncharacterized protein n=1 Tax=Liparis tanakae TaxID=230148 RepID=A0A4Z2I447_9TELE|nr:hypothetical protein EYF80_017041 [Liparis tanakae]